MSDDDYNNHLDEDGVVDDFLEQEPEPTLKAGVYAIFDRTSDEALWVGQSDNIYQRLDNHHNNSDSSNLRGELAEDQNAPIDVENENIWEQTAVKWVELDARKDAIEQTIKEKLDPRYGSD